MKDIFKRMLTLAGVALLLMGCNAVNMEKYVDDLYDRMSQEERIAQLRSGYMDDLFDENGNLDFACGNHLYVDILLVKSLKHL